MIVRIAAGRRIPAIEQRIGEGAGGYRLAKLEGAGSGCAAVFHSDHFDAVGDRHRARQRVGELEQHDEDECEESQVARQKFGKGAGRRFDDAPHRAEMAAVADDAGDVSASASTAA